MWNLQYFRLTAVKFAFSQRPCLGWVGSGRAPSRGPCRSQLVLFLSKAWRGPPTRTTPCSRSLLMRPQVGSSPPLGRLCMGAWGTLRIWFGKRLVSVFWSFKFFFMYLINFQILRKCEVAAYGVRSSFGLKLFLYAYIGRSSKS